MDRSSTQLPLAPSLTKEGGDLWDKNRYPFWLLSFILAAIVFAVYSVSLGHNFLFDEENIILNNPTIRSFHLIPELFKHGYFYFSGRGAPRWDEYYRPLTSLSFMVDYHFWGVDPFGYNLTNLFLHLALCVLYFRFLSKLLNHQTAAFLTALLYGMHTIHTEAVTYTASRGDILGIVLMLSALLFYIRRWPMAALLCYVLALFSKETMILLPFYILAVDLGYVKSRVRDLPINVGPFFLVMLLFWLFRKFLCPIPFTPMDTNWHAMILRILGMGDGLLQYFRALVAPEYFKAFSDVPELYGFTDPLVWTALTVGSLLLAAWLFAWRYRGLAFTGMTIFLIGLVPHFQIFRVFPKWGEHYICISALGLFLILGMLIRGVLESRRRDFLCLFFALYLPFLVFVSFRTWQRNKIYCEPMKYYTLLSQTDTPYRFFGYQQLALRHLRSHDPDAAYVPIRVALAQEFRSVSNHELLGYYFLQKHRPKKALREFKLAYFYSETSSHELYLIGYTMIQLRQYRQAAKIYLLMLRLDPESVSSYIQLMNVYELLDRPDKVARWAKEGLSVFKTSAENEASLLMALARLEYREGNFKDARRQMKEIVDKYPQAAGNADLARFCLGRISQEQFTKLTNEKYLYYKSTLPALTLMASVLRADKARALSLFKKNYRALNKLSETNPLIRREMRSAHKFFDRV